MIGMLRQELLAELDGMLVRPYRTHLDRERFTQLLHLLLTTLSMAMAMETFDYPLSMRII